MPNAGSELHVADSVYLCPFSESFESLDWFAWSETSQAGSGTVSRLVATAW
ncbi:Uncharacterised protein [Enterobacter cloacae]|nr:Uncharacterised protein [Enterobacter cloacae]